MTFDVSRTSAYLFVVFSWNLRFIKSANSLISSIMKVRRVRKPPTILYLDQVRAQTKAFGLVMCGIDRSY